MLDDYMLSVGGILKRALLAPGEEGAATNVLVLLLKILLEDRHRIEGLIRRCVCGFASLHSNDQ